MNKKLLVALLVVGALAVLTTGVVLAQEPTPPTPPGGFGMGPGMMGRFGNSNGEVGPMHEYMEKALADALGISVDELQTQREAGKRVFEIAKDLGFSEDEIPTLLRDAHIKGLEAATADGLISQEMLDWMKGRIQDRADNAGDRTGLRHPFLRGMLRGWRLQQSNPQ